MADNTCKHCGGPADGEYCSEQCATLAAREERQRIQRINDFYDPEGAKKRRQRQQHVADVLSEVFVGGIPFTDD